MKKLGWKALGYALLIIVMSQLVGVATHLMNQPNFVAFNVGGAFLLLILATVIYSFAKLIIIGIQYVEFLTNKYN